MKKEGGVLNGNKCILSDSRVTHNSKFSFVIGSIHCYYGNEHCFALKT
jgi:hypothetical protein